MEILIGKVSRSNTTIVEAKKRRRSRREIEISWSGTCGTWYLWYYAKLQIIVVLQYQNAKLYNYPVLDLCRDLACLSTLCTLVPQVPSTISTKYHKYQIFILRDFLIFFLSKFSSSNAYNLCDGV